MAEDDVRFVPSSILETLNGYRVAYVVIGGVAARAHGSVLRTGDVDICPQDTDDNAQQLAAALTDLGARVYVDDTTPALSVPFDAPFVRQQEILNLITRFGRLDVVWRPAGTAGYDDVAVNARTAAIRGVPVLVADLSTLLRLKEAAGRPKDLAWLEQLRFIRDQRSR